jgi:hypothetical protein
MDALHCKSLSGGATSRRSRSGASACSAYIAAKWVRGRKLSNVTHDTAYAIRSREN